MTASVFLTARWSHLAVLNGEVDRALLELLLPAGAEMESGAPGNGSREEFFVEHYHGYVRQPGGGTLEYAAEHPTPPSSLRVPRFP